jgi:hypothetical protein
VILWLCASLWKDKKCFDTVDARYKHEDHNLLIYGDFRGNVLQVAFINNFFRVIISIIIVRDVQTKSHYRPGQTLRVPGD